MAEARPRAVATPELAATGPAWSQVTVCGSVVYVSGQIACDREGNVIGKGSAGEQAEACFGNLRHALRAAGSDIDRVAKVCIFVTDAAIIPAVRAVRDRWLEGVRPASTLVVVEALVDPDLLVEVDAIASV